MHGTCVCLSSLIKTCNPIPFLSFPIKIKIFLISGIQIVVIRTFFQEFMAFFGKTLSSLASDPLFSTIITFCTLILLYFPTRFLQVVFSPILISTSFLLLSLLRFGAIQRSTEEKDGNEAKMEKKLTISAVLINPSQEKSSHGLIIDNHGRVLSDSNEEREKGTSENSEVNSTQQPIYDLIIDDHKWISSDFSESSECETASAVVHSQKPFYSDSFVEWDVRAPLEVIYEEYEGEDEEDDENDCVSEGKREAQMAIIERYASLSKFYPETDSDISSEEDFLAVRDWDSPEHICFQWEGEEKEGMIEIELGQKKYREVEEENLIEIDLYPASFPVR